MDAENRTGGVNTREKSANHRDRAVERIKSLFIPGNGRPALVQDVEERVYVRRKERGGRVLKLERTGKRSSP